MQQPGDTSVITNERPFGYNEVQWGRPPPQTPHIPNFNEMYTDITTPSQKDQTSHPAFIALVILISIICLLLIGLIFRYCCRTCVGRMDPLGDSSNPEAVARFRDNLRSRDDSSAGRSGGYRLSIDGFFKPVDDFPPSYEELFPQHLEGVRGGNGNESPFKIQDNIISSSQSSPSLAGIIFTRPASQTNQNEVGSPPPTPPIYTIPVLAQQLQSVSSSSHPAVDRTPSAASNNESSDFDHSIINPSFVRVEILPGMGCENDIEMRRRQE